MLHDVANEMFANESSDLNYENLSICSNWMIDSDKQVLNLNANKQLL